MESVVVVVMGNSKSGGGIDCLTSRVLDYVTRRTNDRGHVRGRQRSRPVHAYIQPFIPPTDRFHKWASLRTKCDWMVFY